MLAELLPAIGHVVVTRPSNPRAADPDELAARIRTIAPSLPTSRGVACAGGCGSGEGGADCVVAGSIFLLGDVMQELGA